MNIEQLQYICMVAKTNSITIAAENLYVTQQTISKAINKLEQELGVVLMIRSHKGVQLTDTGVLFVEKASQVVRAFQDLYDFTYINNGSQLSGQVRLYQSNYVGHVFGSKLLTSMQRKYPKLHVIVEEMLTAEMIERVKESSNDMALIQAVNHNCGVGRLEDYAQCLDWECIFRDTLVACVSQDGPLGKRERISLKELLKYPIAWGDCFHMEDILQEDFHINVHVLLNSSNAAMQRDTVREGMAVSFATELIVHNGQYDVSELKVLPIKENLRLETFLIKPKGYELDKVQSVIIEELKKTLQRI